MNSLLISDAYKQSHRVQYPKGTNLVYSNWTPRSDKYAQTKQGVVVFGVQAFLMKLDKWFQDNFFSLSLNQAVDSYVRTYENYFGEVPNTDHVESLHRLGFLPVEVRSLPEGSICPIGVPVLTVHNTISEFYWITNFLETIMSTELWLPMTSATIAHEYKKIFIKWADQTCDNQDHLPFQGHDFSMRGMAGVGAAMASGAGHLLSFWGSDTIPSVDYMDRYYFGRESKEPIAVSVPATEHSVMSMGTRENEIGTFRRLITELYPSGIISIVSDTWDLWKVLDEYVPVLKEDILARDGKVVIRPDSGDPVEIIAGGPNNVGVIQKLWDVFGGTKNDKGYKVLDPHIGAIYGDSITLERAELICARLAEEGFASSNVVLGIGSFTYQYNTRDTYGFAMKATYGEVNRQGREIYKDPVTDDGIKKSLKGLLRVKGTSGNYEVEDQVSWEEAMTGELKPVWSNGRFLSTVSLAEIRQRLNLN